MSIPHTGSGASALIWTCINTCNRPAGGGSSEGLASASRGRDSGTCLPNCKKPFPPAHRVLPFPAALRHPAPHPPHILQEMMSKLLLVLAVVLPCAFPLYFHIKETETKCFIEELPEETMVVGLSAISPFCSYAQTYHRQLQDHPPERRRHVRRHVTWLGHPRRGAGQCVRALVSRLMPLGPRPLPRDCDVQGL